MDKKLNRQNIFDKASLKIQKSKLLKIFIFSCILLSHGKLNCDLIAEELPKTIPENSIKNTEICINCEISDKPLANKLKQFIYDFENDNEICKILVKSLEQNNTTFEICENSDLYAGSYIIGENKILIPKNSIETTDDTSDILRFKRTIAHETVHMIQDKKGIFTDAKKLSPFDCSVVYTIAEIDAICKSYIATENDFWNTNSAFDCLSNMIPSLESYTNQGFYIGQLYTDKNYDIMLKDVVKNFNIDGFDDYKNIDNVITITKNKINPEIINKITNINNKSEKKEIANINNYTTSFEKE